MSTGPGFRRNLQRCGKPRTENAILSLVNNPWTGVLGSRKDVENKKALKAEFSPQVLPGAKVGDIAERFSSLFPPKKCVLGRGLGWFSPAFTVPITTAAIFINISSLGRLVSYPDSQEMVLHEYHHTAPRPVGCSQ